MIGEIKMNIVTLTALLVFFLSFWGYHYLYLWFTKRRGIDTKKCRVDNAIHSWFRSALEEKDHLLMVHQMRNVIMAVTFLATTVVVLLGFLLGFSTLDVGEPTAGFILEGVSFWLIVITLIFSFLNLLLSLRHFIRISFLIKADPEAIEAITGASPQEYLSSLFTRGNDQYTIGRRGVVYAIVVLIWFLNVWVFVASTIMVTSIFALHNDL